MNKTRRQSKRRKKKRTYFVEVEGKLSRYGAVETGLEESGPVLRQDVLAAVVLLADARHARVYVLAAVDVLDGRLAEEKVHVVANVVRADKVWFCTRAMNEGHQKSSTLIH